MKNMLKLIGFSVVCAGMLIGCGKETKQTVAPLTAVEKSPVTGQVQGKQQTPAPAPVTQGKQQQQAPAPTPPKVEAPKKVETPVTQGKQTPAPAPVTQGKQQQQQAPPKPEPVQGKEVGKAMPQ